MRCPHCDIGIKVDWENIELNNDEYFINRVIKSHICSECGNAFFKIIHQSRKTAQYIEFLVYPQSAIRTLSPLIDEKFAKDYHEASLVLNNSPNASAALSRRCIQNILREKLNIKHADLYNEIQQVIDDNLLPPALSNNLDYVRKIGKFAVHPNKSIESGTIIDVEEGEADWSLDVLDSLFEFIFIQPKVDEEKKKKIDEKINATKKQNS